MIAVSRQLTDPKLPGFHAEFQTSRTELGRPCNGAKVSLQGYKRIAEIGSVLDNACAGKRYASVLLQARESVAFAPPDGRPSVAFLVGTKYDAPLSIFIGLQPLNHDSPPTKVQVIRPRYALTLPAPENSA
jgi:hypothetical protein